jgi:colanic acid biosynthesis glycosyl transferase WcaI
MRILFLTQWFQPEPSFKGLPFAKVLQDKGNEVEVLTGFPNYPGGKIYSNYRLRFFQRETMEGIRVHRVALYPSHDKSAIRRIANYISFSISALMIGPWLIRKPDIIYVYNLVTLGPPAFLLRFLFGSKVVMDVQDLWPESVLKSKMLENGFLLNFLSAFSLWVYNNVNKLVVLSPGFKRELASRGVQPEKIEVIYNWCDESSIRKNESLSDLVKHSEFSGKFVVLFAGTMGIAQGLDTLLDCARICSEDLPNVQFVLVGGGVDRPRLENRANAMALSNVTFLPPQPVQAMGKILSSADALIVHLKDDPLFSITIPSKTQAYLYIGKPIIMAVRGDAADLIKASGAGIVCDPETPGELAKSIERLYSMSLEERNDMGKSGMDYYKKYLSFSSGVDKFERLMSAIS